MLSEIALAMKVNDFLVYISSVGLSDYDKTQFSNLEQCFHFQVDSFLTRPK